MSRPPISLGKDIGYIPGTLEEKLGPWMKPIIDNIDFKTNFDRSEGFAKQFLPVAVEFALLGMGFVSAEEALEYLQTE